MLIISELRVTAEWDLKETLFMEMM